jgi:uncharacterized protein DUF6364
MKKVTLSADARLIKRARQVARSQGKTLNEAIREWLVQFTQQAGRAEEYYELMKRLRRTVRANGPYTRDEMNER